MTHTAVTQTATNQTPTTFRGPARPRMGAAAGAVAFLALAAALAPTAAHAQVDAPADPTQGNADAPPAGDRDTLWDRTNFSLTTRATFHLPADLDTDGDVGISRLTGELGVSSLLGNDVFLRLSFGSEFSFYDFDDATGLVANGDPFDTTYQYDINMALSGRFNPKWGWFTGGGLTWAAESGSSGSDIFRARGFGGVRYTFNNDLSIGAGVGVFTRLEDDELIIPLVTLDWKLGPRSQLETGGLGGAGGVGVRYTFKPTRQWDLFGQARWVGREYRLDDDGPIPEGVARDQRFEVAAGARYNFTPNIQVHGRAGVDFFNEIELLDRTGDQISSEDVDPSVVLGIGVTIRF